MSEAPRAVLDAAKTPKADMLDMYDFLGMKQFLPLRGPLKGLLGRLGGLLGRLQAI